MSSSKSLLCSSESPIEMMSTEAAVSAGLSVAFDSSSSIPSPSWIIPKIRVANPSLLTTGNPQLTRVVSYKRIQVSLTALSFLVDLGPLAQVLDDRVVGVDLEDEVHGAGFAASLSLVDFVVARHKTAWFVAQALGDDDLLDFDV